MAKKKNKKSSSPKKRNMPKRKKIQPLSKPRRKAKRKSPVQRRRRLADAFTPETFKTTVRTVGGGALGGGVVLGAEKMGIDNLTLGQKGLVLAGLAIGAGVMNQLNTCAGISGAATYKLVTEQQATMSESNPQMAKYTTELAQLPMFLNENNQPMQLAQGEYMLSESADMMLSEIYGLPNYGPRM